MKWNFYKGILPALLLLFGGSLPAKAGFFRDIKKGFSKVGRGLSGIDNQCYTDCTEAKGCSGRKPSSPRGIQNYMNCKKNCKERCKKKAEYSNNNGKQNHGRNNRGNQSYTKSQQAPKWGYRNDDGDNNYEYDDYGYDDYGYDDYDDEYAY